METITYSELKRNPPFHAAEKEFKITLDGPIPYFQSQRDAMKEIFKKYNGEKDDVIKTYAWMEGKGYAQRKSNLYHLSAMSYAKALYRDGIRRRWLK